MEEEMSASALPKRRRFTIEEFLRMGEAGVFSADERVELIDGEIIEMTPVGADHVDSVLAIEEFLESVVAPELRVVTQNVLVAGRSSPWPDVVVFLRDRLVRGKLPDAEACVLVVEVANSTWFTDRNVKPRIYARAGIPEYWVVDLRSRSVVLHLSPSGDEYSDVREFPVGGAFGSPALGEREVRVDVLLGASE